jgi:aspartyl-tRNA(Asn)/glutamyl-tRNA(Gln) amidotransferase subunit C
MEFDIEHLAKLARLRLTPSEKKKFSKQLLGILAHVAKLGDLDLSEVEPTFQTTGVVNAVSEDKASASRVFSQDEALSGTASKEKGFFRVPKLL